MVILEFFFWGLVLLIGYVYAGYPLLLKLLSVFCRLPVVSGASEPFVTLVISAFNERDVIAHKIENSLNLDYPTDRLEVLVVSDASDDGTDQIVQSYSNQGVQLLRMAERGGKTVGLNAAVARARGEIIIFSDANALYRPDAVRALVAPFDDAGVGAVVGESTYNRADSDSGKSESLYWRYETEIKKLESSIGSVVGGDGAIYAVRRSQYVPMSADALSDFVNPLQVVQSGFRCVYEPTALSYEETADEFAKEYRRKVRIVNRASRALWRMRGMLNPFRYGLFAIELISHKLLRWWVPFMMLLVLVLNLILIGEGVAYQIILLLQLAFYAISVVGFLLQNYNTRSVVFRIPLYFCLVNLAGAVGLIEALLGKSYTTWTTARANS